MKKFRFAVLLLTLCLCLCSCKSADYDKAIEHFIAEDYEAAKEGFTALADYKDSAAMVRKCDYQIALALKEEGKYQDALKQFQALGDYEDSVKQSVSCVCALAEALAGKGNLKEAVSLLTDYYEDPQAKGVFCDILLTEASENYLPHVEQAQETWTEYLLIWMKAVQASADKTRAGQVIDIPKVDYSAPQVVAIQRSMEKAGESMALIREAYSEEVLKICEEDIQNLVHTMLESSEVIEKQFENLDNWAVTTLFYGIQDKNASKANSTLINAIYAMEDALER